MLRLILKVVEYPVVLVVALWALKCACVFAYAERGYVSVGSEVLMFPLVAFVGLWLFEKLIDFVDNHTFLDD